MGKISDLNTRTNITIPKDLKKQLKDIAKKQNRSFNNLVITTLRNLVSSTQKQSAFYMLVTFYKLYAYSIWFVNPYQFSYELLILSYKRRLYHHLLGVPHFHSLECTLITRQSLNFTLRSQLLIAHYFRTQDLTIFHLINFFCFRHIHTYIQLGYYVVV